MKISAKGKFGEVEWTLPEETVTILKRAIALTPSVNRDEVEKNIIAAIREDLQRFLYLEIVSSTGIVADSLEYHFIMDNGLSNIRQALKEAVEKTKKRLLCEELMDRISNDPIVG